MVLSMSLLPLAACIQLLVLQPAAEPESNVVSADNSGEPTTDAASPAVATSPTTEVTPAVETAATSEDVRATAGENSPPAPAKAEPTDATYSEPEMSHGTLVEDLEPPHPARVRWVLDSAITVGGFGTFTILEMWVTPQLAVNVPAQQPPIGGADAAALGHFRPTAAKVSDVLMFSGIALPAVYHGIEAGLRKRDFGRRYGTDLLIYTEALAVNLLVTETLKFAVDRHRPFTHLDPTTVDPSIRDELVAEQAEVDSAKSFPSGHASMSFAAAVAGSTLLTMKLASKRTPKARAVLAVTWIASLGLASTTAALRVVAGKHYPSDVTAGALIGSTIGAVIPLAHLRPRRSKMWSNVDVTPAAVGMRGLSLQGRF